MSIIGVCGVSGRMGRAILNEVLNRGHAPGAAFEHESSPFFGRDAAAVLNRDAFNVMVSAISVDDVSRCDGVIDFSSPAASMRLLAAAKDAKRPLVIGTTGFTPDQRAAIDEAGRDIPVLFSPNMSLGVNLLFRLTEIAAKALQNEFDIEVFEAHHRLKKDAPSGTAKRLVDIIKSSVDELRSADEVHGRNGITGERKNDEIGVMAMRGGDIVGEHTVYFAGIGERIELTHRATRRDIFAAGAVRAIEFLIGKKPGVYTMFDVLGI